MRKYLVLTDKSTYELSPITQEEFELMFAVRGDVELAYEAFLKYNGYQEILNIPYHEMTNAKVIIKKGEPKIELPKKYGHLK